MKRYDCLRAIAPHFGEELVVTNLGAVRHEWQALRPHAGNYHLQNLGLTSSLALGLALALPHRKVVAFDGDGSLLLNLGSLTTMANQHPKNLIHIVFDNECYESSRGAPTATAGLADLAVNSAWGRFCQCPDGEDAARVRRRIFGGFEE
jgi:sulfopyruvate decarboxylase subunit beta